MQIIWIFILLFFQAQSQNIVLSETQSKQIVSQLTGVVYRKQYPPKIYYDIYILQKQILIAIKGGKLNEIFQCKFDSNILNIFDSEYQISQKVYKFNTEECSSEIIKISLYRTSSIGISWHLNVKIATNIVIAHHETNINSYSITFLVLGYTILTALLIPYKRKYLSQIWIRIVSVSLLINLQVIQTILYIILFNLINLFNNEASLFNELSLIGLLFCLVTLSFYQFAYIYSFWKLLNRYLLCRKILSKIILITLIPAFVFLFPILMLWINKGLFYYVYIHLSIILQLIWCTYSSVQTPFRYIFQCIFGIWTLVGINYYNPLFHFQMVTFRLIQPIGIFSLCLIGYSILIYLCCPFKSSRNSQHGKIEKKKICQKIQIFNNTQQPYNQSSNKDLKTQSQLTL